MELMSINSPIRSKRTPNNQFVTTDSSKNIDGIIRIFQQFHEMEAYEDIKLLIAGRGEEEANLKN